MSSRVDQFQALVDRQPDNELFRFSLAQALVAEHQHAAALPHLDRCLDRKPDWMVVRILRGKCLLSLGRRTEARAELEAALRLAVEQQHEEPERELRALLADLAG